MLKSRREGKGGLRAGGVERGQALGQAGGTDSEEGLE